MDEALRAAVESWIAWRESDEERMCQLGSALRLEVPDNWASLDEAARKGIVERVHRVLRCEFKLCHETTVVWIDRPKEDRCSYDPDTGQIAIPRRLLLGEQMDAQLFAGLAHEVRHAWQRDVVQGRAEHPRGEIGRKNLVEGFAAYTDTGPGYLSNPLELDAYDAIADFMSGYLGRPGE